VELVDVLTNQPWPDHALQLIGEGLAAALADDVAGAVHLARRCVVELRKRGWWGDHHLADTLDARLGNGPTPLLRPVPVDLEELAMLLEGDPVLGGGRIDLTTGEVLPSWPGAWLSPSRAAAPFAGSRTSSGTSRSRWRSGTRSPTTASVAAPAPGSRGRGTRRAQAGDVR